MNKEEKLDEFIKEVLESETFPNISEYKKAERLIEIGAKWQEERNGLVEIESRHCEHNFISCGTKAVECTKCKQIFKTKQDETH